MENQLAATQPHVYLDHGIATTSSLDVASYFEKEHYNVLRDIENLTCSAKFNALNFEAVDYTDSKGEKRPMFTMTFSGFVWLVMGFTGSKAAVFKEAYINCFDAMANDQRHEVINLQRQLLEFYQRDAQQLAAINPPSARKPYSDEDRLEIWQMHENGATHRKIGELVGRTAEAVGKVVRSVRDGRFGYIKAMAV